MSAGVNGKAQFVPMVLVPIRALIEPNSLSVRDGVLTVTCMFTPAEAGELRVELGRVLCLANVEDANIIDAVAQEFNVRKDVMMRDDKHPLMAKPRQVAMWLYRRITNMSFAEIGARFPRQNGKARNHGTAMHAYETMEAEMARGQTRYAIGAKALLEKFLKITPTNEAPNALSEVRDEHRPPGASQEPTH